MENFFGAEYLEVVENEVHYGSGRPPADRICNMTGVGTNQCWQTAV